MPRFILRTRKHDAWNRMWQVAGFSGLLNRLDSWFGNSNKLRYKNFHNNVSVSCYLVHTFLTLLTFETCQFTRISLCMKFHENVTVHYMKYYIRSSNEGVRSRGKIHFTTDRTSYFWYTCIQLNTIRVKRKLKWKWLTVKEFYSWFQ
jgi:hypothetical protein